MWASLSRVKRYVWMRNVIAGNGLKRGKNLKTFKRKRKIAKAV